MKKILKFTMIISLFLWIAQYSYAQNNIDTGLLQGSWTFDYDTSLANMDTKSKEHVSNMKPTMKNMLEQSYRNRQITFFENGDYLQVFSDGRQRTGNWSNPKGVILEIRNPKGRVNSFSIAVLSSSKLVLIPVVKGKSKAVFTNWCFNKN